MGKETSYNRKNVQYTKIRRRKLQDIKRTYKENHPAPAAQVPDKKKRREQRKLDKKLAKKDAKRAKRDTMNVEEDDDEFEDMEEEKEK